MTSTIARHDDQTIELTITVSWPEIAKVYEEVVEEVTKQTQVAGFRRGKAPSTLVEKNLDKTKTYEETIKKLIPQAYAEAVKQHGLHPIILPVIDLKQAQEGKDWVVVAKTCEKPKLDLGDYRTSLRNLKIDKTKKIYLPGQPEKPEDPGKNKQAKIEELVETLLKTVKITIPQLLIDGEINHSLSNLIDTTRKLGLTVDQYLTSTGRTNESLRAEYAAAAKRQLTLEFALEAIAEKEQITVSDAEIETAIKAAKSPQEEKMLQSQRYYLAQLLRRQKTLDFLNGL